jgi:DNA-directed RNA polymerase subunit A'
MDQEYKIVTGSLATIAEHQDENDDDDVDKKKEELQVAQVIQQKSKFEEGVLTGIRFGLLNDKGLKNISVAELSHNPASCRKNHAVLESATDPRLGCVLNNVACTTCSQDALGCAGHVMHLKLAWPCAGGSFVPLIAPVATIFCNNCSAMLIPEHNKVLQALRKQNVPEHIKPMKAINALYKEALKFRVCGQQKPEDMKSIEAYIKQAYDKTPDQDMDEYTTEQDQRELMTPIMIINRQKMGQMGCGYRNPIFWKRFVDVLIRPVWLTSKPPTITMYHLLSMFKNISIENTRVCGFNAPAASMSALITQYFLMMPMLTRPPRSRRAQDDLTQRLEDIIKINHTVKEDLRSGNLSLTVHNNGVACAGCKFFECPGEDRYSEEDRPRRSANAPKQTPLVPKHLASLFELQRQIAGFSYSKLNQKKDLDYGRDRGCVSDAFKASENGENKGMIRGNIMGRRSNGSARAPISPNSEMPLDCAGVPMFICMNLTVEVIVTKYNYHELLEKVLRGNTYPGAIKVTQDGQDYLLPGFAQGGLKIGSIVHCHLTPLSWHLFNRQPSLHHWSMMALRIIPVPGLSFQLHPCLCDPYGADFDGDEMSMLVITDDMSLAESFLMRAGNNMFRNGRLIIKLIQHSCLGCYQITAEETMIERDYGFHLMTVSGLGDYIYDRFTGENQVCWPISGRMFLSRLIGSQFYQGDRQLKKADINFVLGNVIRWYGNGVDILSGFCRLFETHASLHVTTLGYDDVHVPKPLHILQTVQVVENKIFALEEQKNLLKSSTIQAGDIAMLGKIESHVCKLLDQIRDIVGNYVRTTLQKREFHPLIDCTESGAKGSAASIISTCAKLGQQKDRKGQRLDVLTPHITDILTHHGYVRRCLEEGLTALQMFYHAAATRNGLVDGAVLIKRIGYVFRKLYKALEDCMIFFDNSIRIHTVGLMLVPRFGFDTTYLNPVYVKCLDLYGTANQIRTTYLYNHGKYADREIESLLFVRARILSKQKNIHRSMPLPIQWNMLPEVVRECSNEPYCMTRKESNIDEFADLVRVMVNDCWKRMVVEDYLPCSDMFLLSYRENLCSKRLIEELGVKTITQMIYIMKFVAKSLVKNLSEQGTPIGPNVAQDFSAPLEQDSLKSFHRGGKESALNGGLARVEEMLALPTQIATPSMRLYPIDQEGFDPISLIQIRILDLTDGFLDHPFDQKEEEEEHKIEILGEELNNDDVLVPIYAITCCLMLKRNIMIEYKISPMRLQQFILNHPEIDEEEDIIAISCSELEAETWWVCIKIKSNSLLLATDKKPKKKQNTGDEKESKTPEQGQRYQDEDDNNQPIKIKKKRRIIRKGTKKPKKPKKQKKKKDLPMLPTTYCNNLYYKLTLRDSNRLLTGVRNIIDFFETQEIINVVQLDEKTGDYILKKEERRVIVTRGSNVYELSRSNGRFANQFMTSLTKSNDIHEIYELYGIDAACKAIEDELCHIMLSNDASVARSHIHVIAAFMCITGRPMPLNYSGMVAMGANKLKLCTYEKVLSGFLDVGTSGHHNDLTGLSESVMVGKPFSVGTGSVHLIPANDEPKIVIEKNPLPLHGPQIIPAAPKIESYLTVGFKPSSLDYIKRGGVNQPFGEYFDAKCPPSHKKMTPARSNKNIVHLPPSTKKRPPKKSTYQKKIKKPKQEGEKKSKKKYSKKPKLLLKTDDDGEEQKKEKKPKIKKEKKEKPILQNFQTTKPSLTSNISLLQTLMAKCNLTRDTKRKETNISSEDDDDDDYDNTNTKTQSPTTIVKREEIEEKKVSSMNPLLTNLKNRKTNPTTQPSFLCKTNSTFSKHRMILKTREKVLKPAKTITIQEPQVKHWHYDEVFRPS